MHRLAALSSRAAAISLTAIWLVGCSLLLPPIHVDGGGDRGCAAFPEIYTPPVVKSVLMTANAQARADGAIDDLLGLREFEKAVGDHNATHRKICDAPAAGAK